VQPWPAIDDVTKDDWADVVVIGPGLGRLPDTRKAIESAAKRFECAMVIDADGLNAFEKDLKGLKGIVGRRPVVITPHVVEMGRLLGEYPEVVLDRRFEIGHEVREKTGATVLLKGVPTVIGSLVVAAGTPALATAGSGDVLSGIVGTLLAQMSDSPDRAAASAAWIHGRAAELAGPHSRGTALEDVLEALPNAWRIPEAPPRYPVMAELPAVGDA
jgi:hydroxyethylthiazole kinase-like uncharacterized protein yjeF